MLLISYLIYFNLEARSIWCSLELERSGGLVIWIIFYYYGIKLHCSKKIIAADFGEGMGILITGHMCFLECCFFCSHLVVIWQTLWCAKSPFKSMLPQLWECYQQMVFKSQSLWGLPIWVQGGTTSQGSSHPVTDPCGSIKAWPYQPNSQSLWRIILALEPPMGLALQHQIFLGRFCFLLRSQMFLARQSLIKLYAQLHLEASFPGKPSCSNTSSLHVHFASFNHLSLKI